MISHMSVENFKSWKEAKDIRLAPITGLFGSNSSGKTSLLQLLLMLKQTTESPDRTQVLHLGDDRSLVELGIFSDIVFGHGNGTRLQWQIAWNLSKDLKVEDPERKANLLFKGRNMEFEATVEENGTGRVASSMAYKFDLWQFGMRLKTKQKNKYELFAESSPNARSFKLKHMPGRVWELPAPVKCYGFPDQVKAYYQNAGFLSDFELAFENLFSNVYYLGPLRDYPKRQYTWAGGQPADMGR